MRRVLAVFMLDDLVVLAVALKTLEVTGLTTTYVPSAHAGQRHACVYLRVRKLFRHLRTIGRLG